MINLLNSLFKKIALSGISKKLIQIKHLLAHQKTTSSIKFSIYTSNSQSIIYNSNKNRTKPNSIEWLYVLTKNDLLYKIHKSFGHFQFKNQEFKTENFAKVNSLTNKWRWISVKNLFSSSFRFSPLRQHHSSGDTLTNGAKAQKSDLTFP